MLEISHLTKKFDKDTAAVDDVSLSLEKGSIYSLIGPNGSGKTTIIKMIAGLLQPTSGEITVDGISVSGESIEAKKKIGFIPDNPTVWGKMTGREFMDFTGALYGYDVKTREKRIEELLPAFSLQGVGDMYFEYYSRGNRQKFTILAALLHEPDLLLIDEPIIGLDPQSVRILESLLTDYRDNGGTVLITTHMLEIADRVADSAGVIVNGELKVTGTLSELREKAGVPDHAKLHAIYSVFGTSHEKISD